MIAYYPIELWTSERTVEAYRQYARLHMSLVPYLYSYAAIAHRTGHPIMRHLYLAYPDDANVRNLDYQYLLGEALLVAPVLAPGVDTWRVYLPEGEWISWWDGESFSGPGWINAPAPLQQIPLFVKAGAIVPRLPDDVDTLAPAADPAIRAANDDLAIDVFAASGQVSSTFAFWDGTELRWDSQAGAFNVSGSPVTRKYVIRFQECGVVENVRLDGLEGDRTPEWRCDEASGVVVVEHEAADFKMWLQRSN